MTLRKVDVFWPKTGFHYEVELLPNGAADAVFRDVPSEFTRVMLWNCRRQNPPSKMVGKLIKLAGGYVGK